MNNLLLKMDKNITLNKLILIKIFLFKIKV